MSADNWRVCPKCEAKVQAHQATLRERAEKAYGKVPPEQYLDMLKNVDDDPKLPIDLREDYELGIDGHRFYVSYHAQCITCGWTYEFSYEKKVE